MLLNLFHMVGLDLKKLFPPKPCYDTPLEDTTSAMRIPVLGVRSAFFPILSQRNPLHIQSHGGTRGTEPNPGLCLTNRGSCGSSSSWSSSLPWNYQPWLFYHLHTSQGVYSYLHPLFLRHRTHRVPAAISQPSGDAASVAFAVFPTSLPSQRINHFWSIITSIFSFLCLYCNSPFVSVSRL